MPIRTKRVYDSRDPADGHRLLVMRLWPRGVRREAVDEWQRELAPSETLLQAYRHGGLPWEEFAEAYREEVAPRNALLQDLARRAGKGTVTLLCSCDEESRCHRSLLRELVEAMPARG